jgi:hypothetical protein
MISKTSINKLNNRFKRGSHEGQLPNLGSELVPMFANTIIDRFLPH